jgi:hypothetical protein
MCFENCNDLGGKKENSTGNWEYKLIRTTVDTWEFS